VHGTRNKEPRHVRQPREGKQVPGVSFRIRKDDDWASVSTEQIFKGRTAVVFSLPGAFTPTCSLTHLPRYNELAQHLLCQRRRRDRRRLGQ
jgi:peroxiredoxin